MPTRAPTARPGGPHPDLLQHLRAEHREILVATYFRRRTTREAAWQLGLPPDAVKARLYHAVRALSDLLATETARPRHRATAHREAGR